MTKEASRELEALLDAAAQPQVREHWERHLKGAASFRGVPMAGIRRAVEDVWASHNLDALNADRLLELSAEWFRHHHSEDKLAAILMLSEHALSRLEDRHADALAAPLRRGDISDWNVCDWYATKTLHGFISFDAPARGPRVATWAGGETLWMRRASIVAFVKLATRGDLPEAMLPGLLEACSTNLLSDERFAHTGVGWLLRELSRHHPRQVEAFLTAHPQLSNEAQRMARARIRPGPYQRR